MYTVKNFSRYFATEDGQIFSNNYKKTGRTQALKPAVSTDGYLKTVLLDDNGKYHTIAVHRWVAEGYFGTKKPGQEVNHKDGVKTHNGKTNLEYCTRSENVQHAFDTGLAKKILGSANHSAKLTEDDVVFIRRQAANGGRFYGRKELADKFGVSQSHIKDLVTRRRNAWRHV